MRRQSEKKPIYKIEKLRYQVRFLKSRLKKYYI